MNEETRQEHAAIKSEYIRLAAIPGAKRRDIVEALSAKFFKAEPTINKILPALIRKPYIKHEEQPGEFKTCNRCGEEKHVSEYYAHPGTKDKLFGHCITCNAEAEKVRNRKRIWKKKKGNIYAFYP